MPLVCALDIINIMFKCARKLPSCFHMASVMLGVRSTSVVPRLIPSFSACNIEMLGESGNKVKLSVLIKVLFI